MTEPTTVPDKATWLRPDDTLIMYGETETVGSVAHRCEGHAVDRGHDEHRLG